MNAMHNSRNSGQLLLGACAAILLAAGATTALAQASAEGGLSGSFSQPLNKKAKAAAAQSNTTMMVSESDGDDTYTLKIAGDDVAAEINGKKVPQDRIRRKGDTVELLGKDGEVVHKFQISGMNTGKVGVWSGTPQRGQPPVPPVPPAMDEPEMAPPPVMLGLLMTDNTDAGGIEVAEVFPGMPAANAGLQKGDLIVKLDGKGVESAADLREVIVKKKGGDTLEVVVERDGEKKTLTVNLVAYDHEAMGKARAKATGEPQIQEWKIPGFGGTMRMEDDWSAQAKRALEKALTELNKEGINTDQWKAEIQKALEQALAGVEKASGQMRLKVQEWGGPDQPGPGARVWGGDNAGQGRVFVMPRSGGGGGAGGQRPAEMSDKLDRLTEQLERLNKRLADMEKKLAEHKQP